jgi:hypothetical protein
MEFIPVTPGSEYWDKVEAYKQKLNCLKIEQAVADNWESERSTEIRAELNEIMSYIQTTEGQQYVVKLNKEDGR